jgi:quinol monooxygenase YgiN
MYAHITRIRVPLGQMNAFRQQLSREYLQPVRRQPGFIRAYFLEQVDDPDRAQLVQVWESQAALEEYRRTGTIEQVNQRLHAAFRQLELQSQGYLLRSAPETADV